MGIKVPKQQHHREEDQAGRPYGRRSTQHGQQLLCRHRLHHKEQEGTQENRESVEGAEKLHGVFERLGVFPRAAAGTTRMYHTPPPARSRAR